MNLRTKLTVAMLTLVLSTIGLSFYFIHDHTNKEFEYFLQQKEEELNRIDPLGVLPRNPRAMVWRMRENSPEQRFIQTTQQALLLAGFLSVLLSLVLAFFLSKVLLSKITLLRQAIEEYKEKRKHLTLPKETKDEIDELAQRYNELIENLEKQEGIRKDFFVDLAHEVRTPITVIRGYMEGLFDGVFKPSEDIYVKVLAELERMQHLVSQMSSMAKLEAGNIELHPTTIDLAHVVSEVCDTYAQRLNERELTLRMEGTGNVEGDLDRMRQILNNLIGNAVSYADAKTEICICVHPKKQVLFTVENSAKALTQRDLERIFHRFVRLDQARTYTSEEPHLGVGLNIVKKLVEAHGWKICAEKQGQRVKFIVTK